MARPRTKLSAKLHELCDNVYFQPPTGTKLTYPCIVYKIEDMNIRFADNSPYSLCNEYSLIYMTRDPDDNVMFDIVKMPMCSFERQAPNENIYHNYYRLYF